MIDEPRRQLSQVAQQNAAASEEPSATAVELTGQAGQLQALMRRVSVSAGADA